MKILGYMALLLLAVAIAIQLQQFVTWGHLWDWDQLHHETFSIALAFGCVVLLIVDHRYSVRRR